MSEVPVVSPVAGGERIALWDVLRGFAVLGILLANIPFMAMAGVMTDPDWYFVGGDRAIDYLSYYFVYVFADTKFVTIFSTLFGAGLALMCEKANAAGASFVGHYSRRLLVLLVFGVVHGTLIWFGDILTMYALIGFLAMVFRNCRVRTLLTPGLHRPGHGDVPDPERVQDLHDHPPGKNLHGPRGLPVPKGR